MIDLQMLREKFYNKLGDVKKYKTQIVVWNKGEKNMSASIEEEIKTVSLLWIYLDQTFNAGKSRNLLYQFASSPEIC